MYRDDFTDIEAKEEELFKEKYAQQIRVMRKVFLIVFSGIGTLFATGGIILWALKVVDEDGFLFGIAFAIMGAFFILMGIIFSLVTPRPDKLNYEKIKARMNKYGGANMAGNSIYLSTTIAVQKEQIKELSIRIVQLEDDVKRLRNERRN